MQLHGSNFIDEMHKNVQECEEYIAGLLKKTLEIQVDENKLYSLNMELAKYASIKNADYYGNAPLAQINRLYLSPIQKVQDS